MTGEPRLDEQLARRREALARRLLRRRRVGARDAAELQALAALAALARPAAPPPRKRWPLAAVFVGTLVAASLLLFGRTSETGIELEAAASEIRFEAAAEGPLTGTLRLQSLRVAGAARATGSGAPTVVVMRATDGPCAGALTLEPIVLPAGAWVGLHASATPGRVQVSLRAPGARLLATASGCRGQGPLPQPVELVLGEAEADLDLVAADGALLAFETPVKARAVSFARVEQLAQGEATFVRQTSTLRSGTLRLVSLDNRTLPLGHGETLRFQRCEGEWRTIEPAAATIGVRFAGRVAGMTGGPLDHPRSLMPTWLEWLRANQALPLLWGAAVYAVGVAAAVLRWWRGSAAA